MYTGTQAGVAFQKLPGTAGKLLSEAKDVIRIQAQLQFMTTVQIARYSGMTAEMKGIAVLQVNCSGLGKYILVLLTAHIYYSITVLHK